MASTTSMSDFTLGAKIGSGAFSDVFKVNRKSDGKEYALKKVKLSKLSEKEKDNAINEVRILASVQHENIAGYKEAFYDEKTLTLCIVMEYCNGGDLQTKINTLKKTNSHMKESEIWQILYQMVTGLAALHKRKIVHRDLKCANVFLTKEGLVKLGDLNVSKIAKAGVMNTQTGTPYYASPEVWRDKPYDKSSDIWSLGAVLYEMTALHPPFQAKDMKGLFAKVTKGIYPKIPSQYSSDLNQIIAGLLQVDPRRRPTAEQILQTPVFQQNMHSNHSLQRPDLEGTFNPADLLGTIKVPKNLSLLAERLPKAQYEQQQQLESREFEVEPQKIPDMIRQSDLHHIQQLLKEPVMPLPEPSQILPESQRLSQKQRQSDYNQLPLQHQQSNKLIDHESRQSHADLLIYNQRSQKKERIVGTSKPVKQDHNYYNNMLARKQSTLKKRALQEHQNSSPQVVEHKKYYQDVPEPVSIGSPGQIMTPNFSNEQVPNLQQLEQRYLQNVQDESRLQRRPNDLQQQVGVGPGQDLRGQKYQQNRISQIIRDSKDYQDPLLMLQKQNDHISSHENLVHQKNQRHRQFVAASQDSAPDRRDQAKIIMEDLSSNQGNQRMVLPRTRSKDSIPSLMQNQNMRNRYGGVADTVEQGRLESQRLLMERYKHLDHVSSQQLIEQQYLNAEIPYLPRNQHVVQAGANYQNAINAAHIQRSPPLLPQQRNYIPMSQMVSQRSEKQQQYPVNAVGKYIYNSEQQIGSAVVKPQSVMNRNVPSRAAQRHQQPLGQKDNSGKPDWWG